MKNGVNFSRRTFLKGLAAVAVISSFLSSCRDSVLRIVFKLSGTNHILGHRLITKDFPEPVRLLEVPYLIVGGGISGLSAARQLVKRGVDDFLLLELEQNVGGNSSSGENSLSKYPLAAHYLPLPNLHDKALIEFLEESKIITGRDDQGQPLYDEEQLVFSPQERLFFRNSWQEGLIPKADEAEFLRFLEEMDEFRTAKGEDKKYLFDIPVAFSSAEPNIQALDQITMASWLSDRGFKSEHLLAYVDYCCRDDFGLGIQYVSAWAGIHYFAARKGDGADSNVLTWPEGNARLASHLKKYSQQKTMTGTIVYNIAVNNENCVVSAFDEIKKESFEIRAGKVILATPQYVNDRILPKRKFAQNFNYAPWLTATLIVAPFFNNSGHPLSWDNVIHGGKGLGYIFDQHQSLGQAREKLVITYYYSFSTSDAKSSRRQMFSRNEEFWKQFVFDDLKAAHPNIQQLTESITVHLIGHGMISPVPGFLSGKARSDAAAPIDSKVYFAHSDLAGISIFEEAFHQGINAVNQML